ncbi:MAG: PDZ domain-containing protein [Magnetococcales bacterium]|nr:PDZ domain-containing protein [Magnetococcales bacterium]MBF0420925.1 PDZ domain-containing protein [Magnetococcales bacterium]
MKNMGQGVVAGGILVVLAILVYGLFASPNYSSLKGSGPGKGGAPVDPGQPVAMNVGLMAPDGVSNPAPPQSVAPVSEFIPAKPQLAEAHWQGMEVIPLTSELKKKLNLPMNTQGVLIDEVTLQSIQAGLLAGDILVAVNSRQVLSLEDVYRESRGVQNQESVVLTVTRSGQWKNFQLLAAPGENLGFAQVETAPMILPGDIKPHRYRGPCTMCHAIGQTGHLVPDPDGIILPPPAIKAGVPRPHMDRGPCLACHRIIP